MDLMFVDRVCRMASWPIMSGRGWSRYCRRSSHNVTAGGGNIGRWSRARSSGIAPAAHGETCRNGSLPGRRARYRFYRWTDDGTWDRILIELQQQADVACEVDWTVSVDFTVVRPISTPSEQKGNPQAPGRSRGRLSIKIYLVIDGCGHRRAGVADRRVRTGRTHQAAAGGRVALGHGNHRQATPEGRP